MVILITLSRSLVISAKKYLLFIVYWILIWIINFESCVSNCYWTLSLLVIGADYCILIVHLIIVFWAVKILYFIYLELINWTFIIFQKIIRCIEKFFILFDSLEFLLLYKLRPIYDRIKRLYLKSFIEINWVSFWVINILDFWLLNRSVFF